ncbi:MAG TPA: PRC-barrel domain-containing protein [Longimicrobiales bacterium]|nr:PRC-barrel domain-containing protein [Longimicrobiales bacterium]
MPDDTAPRAVVLRTRDVVGQDVAGADGKKAASVKDVLLERDARETRFLALDLGLFKNQVLVPVDEVEPGAAGFVLRRWTVDDLRSLPAYQADRPLTADVLEEMAIAHPRAYGDLRFAPTERVSGDGVVVPLKQAKKFRLAEGAPDLRGWNVFGADGERVGVVTEMLVQPAAGRVRYLDVDVMEDLFSLAEDRHILVPLEAVSLKERGRDIWFERAPAAIVKRLPAYTGGELDPAIAERVDAAFATEEAVSAPGGGEALEEDRAGMEPGRPAVESGRAEAEPGLAAMERGRPALESASGRGEGEPGGPPDRGLAPESMPPGEPPYGEPEDAGRGGPGSRPPE